MACEDWPCCGHEQGCCPDFDPETGEQLNMKCVCGAVLPIDNRSSLCATCLRDPDDPDQYLAGYEDGQCCDDPTPAIDDSGQRYCEACDSDLD